MNIEELEKTALETARKLISVVDKKIAEIESMSAKELVDTRQKPTTQFYGLSAESRQKAREVLAGMLLAKYQSGYDLPDNTVTYLGRRVREAFVALETERPTRGSGED